MPVAASVADPVDPILALDPGARGIAAFFARGGALAAAPTLLRARRVLLTTGFAVADGVAETDGPPGTAVLGRALRLLGAQVRYVTDAVTVPLLEAALKALDEPVDILTYRGEPGAAPALLQRERPTHLVAVERPGRGRDGDYRNARGESVARWNAPLDDLFLLAQRGRPASRTGQRRLAPGSPPPLRTIGVGDGGNEIGMGNVRARLVRQTPLFARIASVVKVDHLVVAGTSNWGAYGIAAHLGALAGRDLLHNAALERRMVEACVAAGAVDGITRRREPTVDGLSLDVHAGIVELLRQASGRIAVPRGRRGRAS
ncbi:MAG: DUF4392 domain-containing protein [Candidatus Rokuibacteriota bacterium]